MYNINSKYNLKEIFLTYRYHLINKRMRTSNHSTWKLTKLSKMWTSQANHWCWCLLVSLTWSKKELNYHLPWIRCLSLRGYWLSDVTKQLPVPIYTPEWGITQCGLRFLVHSKETKQWQSTGSNQQPLTQEPTTSSLTTWTLCLCISSSIPFPHIGHGQVTPIDIIKLSVYKSIPLTCTLQSNQSLIRHIMNESAKQ